jgi:hypothetical protein
MNSRGQKRGLALAQSLATCHLSPAFRSNTYLRSPVIPQQKDRIVCKLMEARGGIEPPNKGFAGLFHHPFPTIARCKRKIRALGLCPHSWQFSGDSLKNHYEVNRETCEAAVWLHRKDGTIWGCRIDLEDLPLVSSVPNTWHASWDAGSQTFYAVHNGRHCGKQRTVLMHRLVMGEPAGMEIDHGNHHGLDNRKQNLTITTRRGNALNRQGANRNNRSGAYGVYFHKGTGKFRAWISVDGKRKELSGGFATSNEAAIARGAYFGAAA